MRVWTICRVFSDPVTYKHVELKAAFLALQTFTTMKTNIHVSLWLDNRTAIAYINQKGGTHSKPLSDTACNLWSWCLKRGITIQAEHIAGVENTRADFESRVFQDPCDWMLSRLVYLKIKEKWGTMDVDLFAARHNHQIKRYYSYRPDPGAMAVDAFSDKEVLQLSAGSRSNGSGCFFTGLESSSPICFPTISACGKSSPEDPTRMSREGSSISSSMAETTLVPVVIGNDHRSANLSPTVQEPAPKPTGENSSTTGGEPTALSCVASVRNSLQKQGISQEAADICSSWRKSTEKSYTSAWNKWSSWCEERGKNSFSASIAEIADFLTHQFNSGKQHSTINSYRPAISNTHPQIDGHPVGKHPIICRLMQGMFNERPSEPKYSEIWDIDEVLSYLELMADPADLSVKELTLKTVMLMALANADRASDLHVLDIRYIVHAVPIR